MEKKTSPHQQASFSERNRRISQGDTQIEQNQFQDAVLKKLNEMQKQIDKKNASKRENFLYSMRLLNVNVSSEEYEKLQKISTELFGMKRNNGVFVFAVILTLLCIAGSVIIAINFKPFTLEIFLLLFSSCIVTLALFFAISAIIDRLNIIIQLLDK